jgi:polyferredoxin
MKRQKVRNALLLISVLLFPIIINYQSPYLIISGSFEGVITGSFLLFASLFVTSLFFGRAFCGWLCPAGGIQECSARVNNRPTGKKQNIIKYVIWIPWILTIAAGFFTAGGIKRIDPIYMTDHGISVSNIYGYFIYIPVTALILTVSLAFGRRSFCHSLCWMAPFVIAGSKIKNKLKYPSLHLEGCAEKCIDCKLCNKNCPMSLDVNNMVKQGKMDHNECILCGQCRNTCNKAAIYMGFKSKYKKEAASKQENGDISVNSR